VVVESNMALDTVAIGIYVCDFPVRPKCLLRRSTHPVPPYRRGAAANLNPGNHRFGLCVSRVGVDVPRDSCWDRILPTNSVGWFSPPSHWFDLYPILRWKTGVRPTPAHWRMSFITGFLLLGVGNGGVCLAERTVPSGVTALLVATVSLWMVIVDWLRPGGTRPGGRVAAGLLLGFAG